MAAFMGIRLVLGGALLLLCSHLCSALRGGGDGDYDTKEEEEEEEKKYRV